MSDIAGWSWLFILLHFLIHIFGSIGVLYSLLHSYKAHRPSAWKLIVSAAWLLISIAMLYFASTDIEMHRHHSQESCLHEQQTSEVPQQEAHSH